MCQVKAWTFVTSALSEAQSWTWFVGHSDTIVGCGKHEAAMTTDRGSQCSLAQGNSAQWKPISGGEASDRPQAPELPLTRLWRVPFAPT